MNKVLSIVAALVLLSCALQCDEKKPNDVDLEDPGRFFPVNLEYTWTYVRLGIGCSVSEQDSYVVTAQARTTREVEGVEHNGWDLEVIAGGEGTGFVYRVKDTVFYWRDVQSNLPPYKILVGPVKAGTNWKDRPDYGFDYLIVAIEDFYSATMNHTFRGCAKVKRIAPGETKVKYYWWAPAWGRVREADFQSEQCLGGEDLKRLDVNPEYP